MDFDPTSTDAPLEEERLDEDLPVEETPDEAAAEVVAETPEPALPATPALSKAPTVGVFDSGIGGFTVASAILKSRPDLNLVYFGDSLNMPYGGRSQEQLARFAHHTIEFLLQQGIDILAVGCNASNSALGYSELHSYSIPSFDLVSSTIDWLRGRPKAPEHIALLATEATVRSGYWQRKLTDAFPKLEVTGIAAPDLVPLIEAPQQDEAAQRAAVRRYLAQVRESGATTVLFGCTHYPLLKSLMVEEDIYLGFIDPAQCLAERLTASLPPAAEDARPGRLTLFSSLPGERFYSAGSRLLGREIRELTRMYIVNPYED